MFVKWVREIVAKSIILLVVLAIQFLANYTLSKTEYVLVWALATICLILITIFLLTDQERRHQIKETKDTKDCKCKECTCNHETPTEQKEK